MNKAFRIYFENEEKTYKKYFQNYATLISTKCNIQSDDAKCFIKFEHAETCIKQIKKTLTANKASEKDGVKNLWQKFNRNYPWFSGFKIEEIEFKEIFYTIRLNIDESFVWLFGVEDNKISLTSDETKAFKIQNYDDVKTLYKIIMDNYEYKSSKIFVKHNYIKENQNE